MISWALVDYTNMGGVIGCIIMDNVQAPHMSMNNSIGSITSYFHTSMAIHLGSNNHLRIPNLIDGNILSSSSMKQQNEKVSFKNGILGVDYKMTINMLMKNVYIVV